MRGVYNAASNSIEAFLNDKLVAGLDLLHELIGNCIFPVEPIAMTADIELFLLVQVLKRPIGCFDVFMVFSRIKISYQFYEYQRYVVGANCCKICANYSLEQVGLDKDEIHPISNTAIQDNF